MFPFTTEWIDLILFSQIFKYFFCYHSLLNQFFQNRHKVKSAWWSPWQFKHLKMWEHSLLFLVLKQRGFAFALALQYQPNSQWFSNLWGPLYLMHLVSCVLHKKVECPHLQQFLHWRTPGLVLAPLIVAINLLMLKHLLTRSLAFAPLWAFHMSI